MKVTVKRADRYARTAIEEAKKLDLEATESLSIHAAVLQADPTGKPTTALLDRINDLVRANTDAVTIAMRLVETAYVIRQQIAEANMQHGIAALLTRESEMKVQQTILGAMLNQLSEKGEEAETAIVKAAHLRANPPSSRDIYGETRDKISVTIPYEALKADLEKRLRVIKADLLIRNERLTMLNVTTHIELDQKVLETLRASHIIES